MLIMIHLFRTLLLFLVSCGLGFAFLVQLSFVVKVQDHGDAEANQHPGEGRYVDVAVVREACKEVTDDGHEAGLAYQGEVMLFLRLVLHEVDLGQLGQDQDHGHHVGDQGQEAGVDGHL